MLKNKFFLGAIGAFLICICSIAYADRSTYPPVFINTLPKSGSMYTASTLGKILNKGFCRISHNTFPKDTIIEKDLIAFLEKRSLTQEHIDPSPHNVRLLKKHNVKFILHIRDPRQAILSWAHHLSYYYKKDGKNPCYYYKKDGKNSYDFPDGFFSWPLEKRIDLLIDTQFSDFVNWIADWVKVHKEGDLDMQILSYEEMNLNPLKHFQTILDFYGIVLSLDSLPQTPRTMDLHYRKGSLDEWRDVFTLDQKRRVNEMIPNELFSEFSWLE